MDSASNGLAMDRRRGFDGASLVLIKSDDDESVVMTHSTYLHLASVLRAAESALRRLIILFMKVKGIKGSIRKVRDDRPLPDFASFGTGENKPPKFNLIDPRKPIVLGWASEDSDQGTPPSVAEQALHASAAQFVNGRWGGYPNEDKEIAEGLLTRLSALDHALKTLPAQAKRMAREIEKRKTAPAGPKCVPPIRIGYPPGYRERHSHDVDHILEECHGLVMDWDRLPDPP